MVCVAPLVKDEKVRQFLIRANEETVEALTMRLNQGVEAQELPSDFPCEERSRMLADMSRGLRMRARLEVPRQELLEDADRAARLLVQMFPAS